MGHKRRRAATAPMGTEWLNAATVIPKEALAISKPKVEAVLLFLQASLGVNSSRVNILVLHGPSSSGKTCLVWSMCSHLSIRAVQVDDLMNVDHVSKEGSSNEYITAACAQSAKFPALPFLAAQPAANKIVFVDDMEAFSDSSLFHLAKTLKGVERGTFVLTCSDWFSICKQNRIFRDLKVDQVCLNPLAPSFIQRAVEYWAGFSASVPKELLDSGDVRSCLYHVYLDSLSCLSTVSVDSCCRDQGLSMFHALGRLFYPLKQREANLWDPYIPDDRSTFHYYIHHNMLPFMRGVEEAALVLDALSSDSDSDVFLVEYTLAVLIGTPGRSPMRVRPSFTRPEYFNAVLKKRADLKVYSADLGGDS